VCLGNISGKMVVVDLLRRVWYLDSKERGVCGAPEWQGGVPVR